MVSSLSSAYRLHDFNAVQIADSLGAELTARDDITVYLHGNSSFSHA
jgi:hypothetical protein